MKRIVFALLLLCAFAARAEYIDLKGGDILTPPQRCVHLGKQYICVLVEFKAKTYLVLVDQKGESQIYQLNDKKDELILIWVRDAI